MMYAQCTTACLVLGTLPLNAVFSKFFKRFLEVNTIIQVFEYPFGTCNEEGICINKVQRIRVVSELLVRIVVFSFAVHPRSLERIIFGAIKQESGIGSDRVFTRTPVQGGYRIEITFEIE